MLSTKDLQTVNNEVYNFKIGFCSSLDLGLSKSSLDWLQLVQNVYWLALKNMSTLPHWLPVKICEDFNIYTFIYILYMLFHIRWKDTLFIRKSLSVVIPIIPVQTDIQLPVQIWSERKQRMSRFLNSVSDLQQIQKLIMTLLYSWMWTCFILRAVWAKPLQYMFCFLWNKACVTVIFTGFSVSKLSEVCALSMRRSWSYQSERLSERFWRLTMRWTINNILNNHIHSFIH